MTWIILGMISAGFALVLGIGAIVRSPRRLVQWCFFAGMVALGAETLLASLASEAILEHEILRWGGGSLFIGSLVPGTWVLFSLGYARGNYREFLHRGRWLVAALFVLPLLLGGLFFERLAHSVAYPGPADEWVMVLGWPGVALQALCLLGAALVLMNLERTFRASVGTMRWRIKFMVLGLGLLFAVRFYTGSQHLVSATLNQSSQIVNAVALLLACVLVARSLRREGLFKVDVYPSQTLLHNSLTLLLAGIYLLSVGVLTKIVTHLRGDAAFPLRASLVLMALVVFVTLLFSERVRLRTRRFISRHFRRPHYDSRQVWTNFVGRTASVMEKGALSREVAKLVSETFQTLSVTIWLLDDKREQLICAASTSVPEAGAAKLMALDGETLTLMEAVRQQPYPVNIDASEEKWVEPLRRCAPDQFSTGGNRVCVPLAAQGELLGLMMVGDRVNGDPISTEEMDLLKCIGDQTAGNLLNIQLSQKVFEAKEMEAFQAMSAFFVHDLKNTVSTLSLMLQNLPAYFEHPAFRKDALGSLSKCVTRLTELIERLSLLRQEMEIKTAPADLSATVAAALNALDGRTGLNIVRDLPALAKVPLDPQQMQKVVTNLLVNAIEAVGEAGEIRVVTGRRQGWAFVLVADNGCGMSPEFLARCLFRPFQTTKKKGIGIGMFLSKMIVEAHQGKIEVESHLGQGTTVTILLPFAKE